MTQQDPDPDPDSESDHYPGWGLILRVLAGLILLTMIMALLAILILT